MMTGLSRRFADSVLRQHRAPLRCARKNFSSISEILELVREGKLYPNEAEKLIKLIESKLTPENTLESFANLDHSRSLRTGFPEAVFGSGKTPLQIATILDDMARSLNDQVAKGAIRESQRAILATR
jgi:NCAIR mutase (PurE)-related protein